MKAASHPLNQNKMIILARAACKPPLQASQKESHMTEQTKLLNMLGLARGARLVSFGHDAAKSALRSGKARLCILCSDASPRLVEEFRFQAKAANVPLHELALTSIDIKHATQYKAAVLTIDDKGFAAKITQLF